ncbi:MAG: hypothetical protein ABJH45_15455 [Paracoccaceae bacterium]
MIKLKRYISLAVLALFAVAAPASAQEISTIPEEIQRDCRGGQAVLYDECGSQTMLLRDAINRAESEGKVLLISYGAEWCIWCHVFQQYVKGHHSTMTYRFSDPGDNETAEVTLDEKPATDPTAAAAALTKFVAEHFVLLHIENFYSSDGYEVLNRTGADSTFDGGLPYIFTVDATGRYATDFKHSDIETRRDNGADWYRGYDRPALMAELARMEAAAGQVTNANGD